MRRREGRIMEQTRVIKDELIRLFADRIRERLKGRLEQVLLFGSRARGDSDLESDYDFLVVVDEVSMDVREILDEVSADFLCRYDTLFSVIPISEERFSKERYNPLLINVRREGIAV